MDGSESEPKIVELTCADSNNYDDYCEYLHITTKLVLVAMVTSLMAVILIS